MTLLKRNTVSSNGSSNAIYWISLERSDNGVFKWSTSNHSFLPETVLNKTVNATFVHRCFALHFGNLLNRNCSEDHYHICEK
jgi:hypothetical protein